MGQRLTISILAKDIDVKDQSYRISDNVDLCIYYHWSGYSESSIEEVLDIIPCLEKWKYGKDKSKNKLLELISDKICVNKRYSEDDKKYIYEFNRNNGIPEVEKDMIQNMLNWSECPVNIDIENDTVDFSGAFWHDEYDEDEGNRIVNLDEHNIDLMETSFSQVEDLLSLIKKEDCSHVIWNNKKWALIR